jgi:hypothetical protein
MTSSSFRTLRIEGNRAAPLTGLQVQIRDPRHPSILTSKDSHAGITIRKSQALNGEVAIEGLQAIIREEEEPVPYEPDMHLRAQCFFRIGMIQINAALVIISQHGLSILLEDGQPARNPFTFRYYAGRNLHLIVENGGSLIIDTSESQHMPIIIPDLLITMRGGSKLEFHGQGKMICKRLQLDIDADCRITNLAVAENLRFQGAVSEECFIGCAIGTTTSLGGTSLRNHGPVLQIPRQDWVERVYQQCCMAGVVVRRGRQRTEHSAAQQILSELGQVNLEPTAAEEEEDEEVDDYAEPPSPLRPPPDPAALEAAAVQASTEETLRVASSLRVARQNAGMAVRKRLLEEQDEFLGKKLKESPPGQIETQCAICKDDLTLHDRGVFSPCNHARCCYECTSRAWLQNEKCPICGISALTVGRLYL